MPLRAAHAQATPRRMCEDLERLEAMTKASRTRWVVALGLRDHCRGALELAGWLAEPTRHPDDPDRLLAVHVVSTAETGLAQRALGETIEMVGLSDRFDEMRVVDSDDPVYCLGEAVDAFGADGILIGRRGEQGWPRLGGVGALLLRNLPAPVVVVPRSLRADDIPPGPILVATDLQDDSVVAARFAAHLSRRYDRELWIVHVTEPTLQWSVLALSPDGAVQADAEQRERATQSLQAWARELSLTPAPKTLLAQGDVLEELTKLLEQHQPLFTVVGSRRLSTLERLFTTSIGTELANHAPYPVAVVSPLEAP